MSPVAIRYCCLPLFCLLAVAWAAAEEPVIRFEEVTEAAGLVEPLAGMMGHGAAWGDFDGDGRTDLFVGGFCDRPDGEYAPAKGPVPNRLFRNMGGGRFEPVENDAVRTFARTSGAVFADLDNNGTLDLYVANNATRKNKAAAEPQRSAKGTHSQLFRNDGGVLVDVSADSGACPESLYTARNIGVMDYDSDGLLDLLLVEDRFTKNPHSVLLKNIGGLKFRDVTAESGLPSDLFGLGLAVGDVNGDSRPDFFIGHSNRLFVSRSGGGFREADAAVFRIEPLDDEDWPCGAVFGDLNRDGRPELVVSTHGVRARNRVFLHEGVKDGLPMYREIARECGLGEVVPAKCPHVEIQDFDNDGWPDIYLSVGWMEGGTVTPLIYRHQGLRGGLPVFAPPRPLTGPLVYFPAGPSADFDQDGRMDLFLVNWFQGNRCRLLRNDSEP